VDRQIRRVIDVENNPCPIPSNTRSALARTSGTRSRRISGISRPSMRNQSYSFLAEFKHRGRQSGFEDATKGFGVSNRSGQ
jgi:hypothetical protein